MFFALALLVHGFAGDFHVHGCAGFRLLGGEGKKGRPGLTHGTAMDSLSNDGFLVGTKYKQTSFVNVNN